MLVDPVAADNYQCAPFLNNAHRSAKLAHRGTPRVPALGSPGQGGTTPQESAVPITVVCRSCHQRFQVSDKFAGKSGPCPKCKATIYVPKADEQVVIHTPEHSEASARGASGQLVLKPISREKTRLETWQIAALAGGSLAVLIGAIVMRWFPEALLPVGIGGLLLLSPLLAIAAYTFLRDAELEPYSGLALWTRAGICGVLYAVCWGAYFWLPDDVKVHSAGEIWKLAFLAPAFAIAGTVIAWATFELDFGNAFFHFCFFVVVTIILAMTMNVPLVPEVKRAALADVQVFLALMLSMPPW